MRTVEFRNFRGFTLVELIIVMVILAILVTVGVVYYVGISAKTRDSARRADIYAIATALEVNKTSEGYRSLESNQFSSFQWRDPFGNAYCIGVGIPPDPIVESLWGDSCPEGFMVVATGVPAGKFSNWKVCSVLENPTPGELKVFCKIQQQ